MVRCLLNARREAPKRRPENAERETERIAKMEFSTEQKNLLEQIFAEAYASGKRAAATSTETAAALPDASVFGTPIADLCKEERWKHEQHGLDIWEKMAHHASANVFPKDGDIFRFKYHGLFYVAPAENAFMLRLRIPGCRLSAAQANAIADITENWGAGTVDITTRGNFQIRRIEPKNILSVLTRLADAGLTSKGSGADNVRNITASATSGFDPNELLDVMPYAHALHHYILNNRELYGLPRKFNVSFDNGGAISVAVDTNDIGFVPVKIQGQANIEDGVYFRVLLAGITGHQHFARDAGILVKAEDAVTVAVAMIKVFIANGDRTNRKKARLVYLLEKWGIEKYLLETQKLLGVRFIEDREGKFAANVNKIPHGHIGVFKQRQSEKNYVGVAVPVGRLDAAQLRGLAQISEKFGEGELRLTVWQNVIVPHIKDENLAKFTKALWALDLTYQTSAVAGGVVACTGNTGCKFAGANTKDTAIASIAHLKGRINLDQPVNIHFTGCAHSCAQHYAGDIGLMGVPLSTGEGFNITLGGGMDQSQGVGREIFWKVARENVPQTLEKIIRTYQSRCNQGESFVEFTRRHDVKTLQEIFS